MVKITCTFEMQRLQALLRDGRRACSTRMQSQHGNSVQAVVDICDQSVERGQTQLSSAAEAQLISALRARPQ